MTESEFSETAVTWTKRDVQNLLQAHTYRSHEAFEFIELLQQQKQRKKWEVEIQLNSETLRLERIFWMSDKGKDCYCKFSDVIEGDATYKTNRFGLPLLLFCGVDNNGITFLIAGCLLSDEHFESYEWALLNFTKLGLPSPKVIFTDGDAEFARAIHMVWPESIHLLCRFHIAQNITKNLAGILREDLNDFLSEFWRVASLEDEAEYLAQLEAMKVRWCNAVHYLTILEAKQKKWAFAYTHQYFVAGMASTQRQESVNFQVKANLINNATLSHLLMGFESFETRAASRMVKASLSTKLLTLSADPMIEGALKALTDYAGTLLKEESTLSLSYVCNEVNDQNDQNTFLVSHKDHPGKGRTVKLVSDTAVCTCRKAVWHGIVCRHILCALRRLNKLDCPVAWFNPRWMSGFSLHSQCHIKINSGLHLETRRNENNSQTEDERLSELTALSKDLILRSVSDDQIYEMVWSSLKSIYSTVSKSQHLVQSSQEINLPTIHNPIKVRTKGRPKTGTKRCQSIADQQRMKKRTQVTCGNCGGVGHNRRACPKQNETVNTATQS